MGTGSSIEIRQSLHDLVNVNANLQIGDADVAVANGVPVKSATSATFEVTSATADNCKINANIQVGDADVAVANGVPVKSATSASFATTSAAADTFLVNANLQVGDADVSLTNAVSVKPATSAAFPVTDNSGTLTVDQATHGNLLADVTLQLADADVTRANPVPVANVSDGATTAVVTLTDANETTLIAAPAASNHLEWLGFSVQMADATPAVATLTIRVGTAGTTEYLVRLAATDGMGVVKTFAEPIPITSATLMSGQLDVANTVIVNMEYKTKAD